MAEPKIRFPKKFMWGAATSAHQVEGNTHNQFTVWEQENAVSLATRAVYHFGELESWDAVKAEATKPQNYISGKGVDHYNRYEQDFDIIKQLQLDAFRFSIEWSRLEPEEGKWNAEAIEHYRRYLQQLNARGITPIVTLFHFTLPVWFAERGEFEKRSNVKYFQRYVEKVITELGQHFKYVITINEPTVHASESYFHGFRPPNKQSKWTMIKVIHNLIYAHNKAAKYIRSVSRKYQVALAHNVVHIYAGDDAKLSEWSAKWSDYFINHYTIARTNKTSTFIGVNYYFSARVYGYRQHNPNQQLSDLGWDMQPNDIRYVLEDLADRYNKPILVTENGVADGNDEFRQWWIAQTIIAMHKAIQNGVSMLGYLHWSLLDNFEWEKGFWPKFGLVAVDRQTGERTVRKSATYYAAVIAKLRKDMK